jgi:hypothetical protein
METKQFNRKGILIGHDLEKATLTFAFAGLTPNKMGTYYLIHQSELQEFQEDVEELIDYTEHLVDMIEDFENSQKIERLDNILSIIKNNE